MQEFDAIISGVPFRSLVLAVFLRVARKLGLYRPPGSGASTPPMEESSRFVWDVHAVGDAHGPEANARNYRERQTIRAFLNSITAGSTITNAAEVGCGYGRLTMVLKEYASRVVGFEREPQLVHIARELNPGIEFFVFDSLRSIAKEYNQKFDFVLTCTVLQHLNDEDCRATLEQIKEMCPRGYVLLIEKTEAISVTENQADGTQFISRARSLDVYSEYMHPYRLVETRERLIEPTYPNPRPGLCMLFQAIEATAKGD